MWQFKYVRVKTFRGDKNRLISNLKFFMITLIFKNIYFIGEF